jgi:hypothetical protein
MNITITLDHEEVVLAVQEYALRRCDPITRDVQKLSVRVDRDKDGRLQATVSGPQSIRSNGPMDR